VNPPVESDEDPVRLRRAGKRGARVVVLLGAVTVLAFAGATTAGRAPGSRRSAVKIKGVQALVTPGTTRPDKTAGGHASTPAYT
jgi:hypothetical protein